MTIKKYMKDQWLLYVGWACFMALTVFILWLTPRYPFHWSVVGYLFLIQGALLLLFQVGNYLLKRSWWRKLTITTDNQLLNNFLSGSRTEEERLHESYVNQLIQEHQETMHRIIANQEEQKDYIDSWVHEIKVPLAASQLLIKSVEFDLPDDKFMTMENELNRMNEYVDQVLYVARLDSFTKDYLIQEEELKSIVQPVIREQANYFIQKSIRYAVRGDNDVVLTDRKWIAFIFRQLLTNAIKYTPSGGNIDITIVRESKEIQLTIRDSGIGIPKEDLNRIFDKGFTGKNGRNAEVHSTGLGLYLAKNLAEKLGISLTVESAEGEGTAMTLHFPQLMYYQETR